MSGEKHPTFKDFVQVSTVDVDAGCIWVGDPCYVLKDEGDTRNKDFGDDWGDICNRMFERSGYNAAELERWGWIDRRDMAVSLDPRVLKLSKSVAAASADEVAKNSLFAKLNILRKTIGNEWEKKNPFVPTVKDTGVANFKHDAGHEGMGTSISTFYGDGCYPVYVEYGEGGRPRRVLIDFDPGPDEDEGDEQE